MTAIVEVDPLTVRAAQDLERAFLSGLADSQNAFERIVETKAWTGLGFGSLSDWWAERVQPVMHSLSMRPSPEMARLAIEAVREEQATLPAPQRSPQRDLARMVGYDQKTVSNWTRSSTEEASSTEDLDRGDVADELETPLPVSMPEGQAWGDAFAAGIDAAEDEAPTAATEPDRPRPPKWDPEDRKRHEDEVARIRDIAAAREQSKTIVTDVTAAVCVVVAGCRLGETGLVTKEMVAKLRSAVDLLEGEL
jgi:hypothetical protein